MKTIEKIYINGEFVTPHGTETLELINPANLELIGTVTSGDEQDALNAIASAKRAFKTFSKSTKEERSEYLQRLYDAVTKRVDDLKDATIAEYGATVQRALWSNKLGAETFLYFKETLKDFDFASTVGKSKVVLEPLGVSVIFTPWNSSTGSICVKLHTSFLLWLHKSLLQNT